MIEKAYYFLGKDVSLGKIENSKDKDFVCRCFISL